MPNGEAMKEKGPKITPDERKAYAQEAELLLGKGRWILSNDCGDMKKSIDPDLKFLRGKVDDTNYEAMADQAINPEGYREYQNAPEQLELAEESIAMAEYAERHDMGDAAVAGFMAAAKYAAQHPEDVEGTKERMAYAAHVASTSAKEKGTWLPLGGTAHAAPIETPEESLAAMRALRSNAKQEHVKTASFWAVQGHESTVVKSIIDGACAPGSIKEYASMSPESANRAAGYIAKYVPSNEAKEIFDSWEAAEIKFKRPKVEEEA